MKKNANELILAFLILLPLVGAAVVWNELPAEMPIHFGLNGSPDTFAKKELAVALIPLVTLLVSLLLKFLPTWGPALNRTPVADRGKVLNLIGLVRIAVVAFLSYVGVILVVHGVNSRLDATWCILFAAIILLSVLSAGMIHSKRNRLYGIRNRWTLESDEVWHKTHVVWGWISAVAFAVIAAVAIRLPTMYLLLAMFITILLIVIGATIFSYRLSKQ